MKYICELCGTIYDEEKGDLRRGIQPGTEFAQLPQDYACPGCGYLKEAFNPVGDARVEKCGSAVNQDSSR